MSASTPIPKQLDEPALDQRRLFELGLARIRRIAAHTWTDHNIHDPGITILELAAYALTDLGNRASIALEDLLASEVNNAENMRSQFFTARTILPSRPLTELDYRKLLIDLPGVANAWIMPAKLELYADTSTGTLRQTPTHAEGEVVVELGGVYDVRLDIEEGQSEKVVESEARRVLDAHRDLGQDFDAISVVEREDFQLCCELDIAPRADAAVIMAELRVRVGDHMAPRVASHGLAELLARTHADARPFTVDEIFSGPALRYGFITDEDLLAAELRTTLRLSDIIHVIMGIPGVVAVRDIVLRPIKASSPPSDPWMVPVTAGCRPTLDWMKSRIVLYKQGLGVGADELRVRARVDELRAEAHVVDDEDRPIPLGRPLAVAEYHSFQNHFPAVYGLGDAGLPSTASLARRVQANQLKAYLLFFDQLLADFLAQLGQLRALYSTAPEQRRARFHQVVDSFRDYARTYGIEAIQDRLDGLDDAEEQEQARERFLDHQIARVAEDFSQLSAVLRSADPEHAGPSVFETKCEFLSEYPQLSAERGLGWNHGLTAPADRWNSPNVSGLERRLARLLGIQDYRRRDLAAPTDGEGMFVIEGILLRPLESDDPLMPICASPNCVDCSDMDPYSHRVYVILPAHGARFQKPEFRRFVEQTIRVECPAQLLPRICWVSTSDMAKVQAAYRGWLLATTPTRAKKLGDLITVLSGVRSVHPSSSLSEFVLGRNALGSQEPGT